MTPFSWRAASRAASRASSACFRNSSSFAFWFWNSASRLDGLGAGFCAAGLGAAERMWGVPVRARAPRITSQRLILRTSDVRLPQDVTDRKRASEKAEKHCQKQEAEAPEGRQELNPTKARAHELGRSI